MAIRNIVTRGYGNGTFNGTIAEVVARGYINTGAVANTLIEQAGSIGRFIFSRIFSRIN